MQAAPSWEITVEPARSAQALDRAEVERALRLFMEPGARHPIQALRSGRWETVTLDDLPAAMEIAERFSEEKGLYLGMNPLRADFERPAKGGWRNGDISRRRWFLIDADATRPDDSNSTEEEKAASKAVIDAIAADLAAKGWPEPIYSDSANGFHLYYRIDLPNDQPSQKLLSAALKALAARFDTDGATVDIGVHDAKRITKLYGSWARKGPHSIARPHRMARLVTVPDPIQIVAPALIEALAAQAPPRGAKSTNGEANGHAETAPYTPYNPSEPTPAPAAANGWTVPTAEAADNGQAYALAALQAEAAKVASTSTRRNNQLYESALKVAGYVASGLLEEAQARASLRAAAEAAGLGKDGDPAEIDRAIDNAFPVGKQTPKTPPEKPAAAKKEKKPRASKPVALDPATGLKESIDDERRLARIYIKRRHSHPDRPTLLDWAGGWHAWRDGAWLPVTDREIDAEITAAAKAEFERIALATNSEVAPFTTRDLANVRNAVRAAVLLPSREAPHQPIWLDQDRPSPAECVNCRNGILHLPTLLSEGPEAALTPPTPLYFTPNALEFDFDPNPPAPAAWLAFLDSVWPNDPESIQALQQWFGYLLTPDTSQQKILLMIGPKRSGKGTVIRTLTKLIGQSNVAAPKLASLGKDFGTECLIGKSVAFCTDARITGRSDTQEIVEVFLSVSGEDPQSTRRKYKSDWTGRLATRFVIAANELPRLGDYSEALLSRLIVLRFAESFEGREDFELEGKIAAELPGILAWAIAGWESLRETRRLIQPASGLDDLEEFRELNNPVGAFINEKCEIDPNATVPKAHLYEAWCQWCKEHGKDRPGDAQGLSRNLKTALAALSVKLHDCKPRVDGRQVRSFQGLRLIDARPF